MVINEKFKQWFAPGIMEGVPFVTYMETDLKDMPITKEEQEMLDLVAERYNLKEEGLELFTYSIEKVKDNLKDQEVLRVVDELSSLQAEQVGEQYTHFLQLLADLKVGETLKFSYWAKLTNYSKWAVSGMDTVRSFVLSPKDLVQILFGKYTVVETDKYMVQTEIPITDDLAGEKALIEASAFDDAFSSLVVKIKRVE